MISFDIYIIVTDVFMIIMKGKIMNIISAITRTLPGGFRSYIKVQREKGALLKISLPAAVLLVTILLMAAVQVRAAFPYDMEEKNILLR